MYKEDIFKECKRKCTCNHKKNFKHNSEVKQQIREIQKDDDLYNIEQRTFVSFATDIVSIIAFIFFGSVIFWLAITRILFDCLKKLYYCDRCTRISVAVIFTMLLLSMTTRLLLNKRALKAQFKEENKKFNISKNVTVVDIPIEPPNLPPPEYLKITLKDKKLAYRISENETSISIPKKFTVTIVDEKKKEVFKTSKDFLIPQMALEMKRPPALIVYLKDIILDNY